MADSQEQTAQLQQLIDRLRAGDVSARDELLSRVIHRFGRIARKMLRKFPGVRRWEQTDDVFQNASMRLIRALGSVIPETPHEFFSLAALQIRRELIDLSRHYNGPEGLGANHATNEWAWPPEGSPRQAYEPVDTSRGASSLASWEEFHRQVDALPDEQREVFDLLWYHGLTQGQSADSLGVCERTIKRRWQAARVNLYRSLGGEMPE